MLGANLSHSFGLLIKSLVNLQVSLINKADGNKMAEMMNPARAMPLKTKQRNNKQYFMQPTSAHNSIIPKNRRITNPIIP